MRRAAVGLHEIKQQRRIGWKDFHPEDYCHRCGTSFEPWYTDNETWLTGTSAWATETGREGVCCVSCFVEMYEAATESKYHWRVIPESLS